MYTQIIQQYLKPQEKTILSYACQYQKSIARQAIHPRKMCTYVRRKDIKKETVDVGITKRTIVWKTICYGLVLQVTFA